MLRRLHAAAIAAVAVTVSAGITAPLVISTISAPATHGAPITPSTPVATVPLAADVRAAHWPTSFHGFSIGRHGGATGNQFGPDIVGGKPDITPVPFAATLFYDQHDGQGPMFRCGASLIAKRHGASYFEINAHCVTDIITPSPTPLPTTGGRMTIHIGSNSVTAQISYTVDQIDVFPDWNWSITTGPHGRIGDIALVRVPTLVPEHPGRIAPSYIGELVSAIGWGDDTVDSDATPDQLQELPEHVAPQSACANAPPPIGAGETCTTSQDGTSPCNGDSGMAVLGHGMTIVGSESRGGNDEGTPCAGTNPSTVITNLADPVYIKWMAARILGPSTADRQSASQDMVALAG